jgi:alcohol dehydrogenase class IV
MAATGFSPVAEFYSPNKVLFGLNASSQVADEVKALGGTKVLVVTDKVLSDLGLAKPILNSLDEAGIPWVMFDEVLPDAPSRKMVKGLGVLRQENCDMVLGFGGGSPIDTCKGISLMVTNGSDIRQWLGFHNVRKKGLPMIAVPTTNVAGADVGFAIITMVGDTEDAHEHGIVADRHAMPDIVINDPLLTVSMPPHVTADTGMDVLATAIESLTAATSNPFSELYAEKIMTLTAKYLPVAVALGSNLEARYYMALAATMSGLAYMSSWLGLIHGVSYAVAGKAGLTHGRSLAPTLAAVMEYNLPGSAGQLRKVAELAGVPTSGMTDLEAGRVAIQAVEEIMDAINMPHHLGHYDITETDIPELAKIAYVDSEIFTRGNPRTYTISDIEDIYRAAL